jgi:hypothetical protein
MQRVLENIFIYLAFVFRPRAMVKIVRDYVAVSKQITEELAKAAKIATELFQTMRDSQDTQMDDEPSESFGWPLEAPAGHEGDGE